MLKQVLLFIICVLLSGSIHGQGYSTHFLSHGTLSITSGDLDGDGDVDLITGGVRNVVWHENQGDGTFMPRTISTDMREVVSIAMVDLDQDGHQDIVVADAFLNSVYWLRNDGNFNFSWIALDSNNGSTRSVAVVDMDGDGDLDVVCAAFSQNKVYWLENNGTQEFTSHDIATALTGAALVVAHDLDNDGDMDVMAALQTSSGSIRLFRNDGAQSFSNELVINTATPRSLDLNDVDQDGLMDVLYTGTGGAGWLKNTGNAFTQQVIYSATVFRGLGAADMDGDGYKDVVLANHTNDRIDLQLNNGSDVFNINGGTIDPWLDNATWVLTVDVNNDGITDLVGASSFDIRVFHNDGAGNFTMSQVDRYLHFARGICHGDFDNDGDTDIMAFGSLYVMFFENMGDGRYIPRLVHDGIPRMQVSNGIYMKAVDMDGDGDPDVAFTEDLGNNVGWIENLGGGSFTKHSVDFLDRAHGLDAADMDGDGDMDLIVSSLQTHVVYWYENDGTQQFTRHTIGVGYSFPHHVLAVDHDADGDIDIFVAYAGSNKIVLHRNQGSNTFVDQVIDANAPFVTCVMAVDMDGDGDLDLVAANGGENRITWYESNGSSIPTFTEHVLASGVTNVRYVAAADLDGDGDIDVVSSRTTNGTTDWWENNGSQSFARRQLARNLPDPRFVGIGDLDGDGVPEIYATDMGSEVVQLYRRLDPAASTPPPTACHDLFMSTYLHADAGDGRAIGIYNPRTVPVDLAGYALRVYPDGNGYSFATIPLMGQIPAQGTHTLVHSGSPQVLLNLADQVASISYMGAESIVLVRNGIPIDVFGKVGDVVGSYWWSNGVGTYNSVLVRKPTVDRGDHIGDDAFLPDEEWLGYPATDLSHFGSHTSPCGAICTPTVTITVSAMEICPGEQVTVTATALNEGSAPTYQWTWNNAPVGTNASAWTTTSFTASGSIRCTVVSNAACAPSVPVQSNAMVITVVQVGTPVASIDGNILSASPVAGGSYQWYHEGDAIPGATGNAHAATMPGQYTVTATVDGCISPASNPVLYEISTGIDPAEGGGLIVHPNPTSGELFIVSDRPIERVVVWNALGVVVAEGSGHQLDLGRLAPGIYHLGIHRDGMREIRRVQVQ